MIEEENVSKQEQSSDQNTEVVDFFDKKLDEKKRDEVYYQWCSDQISSAFQVPAAEISLLTDKGSSASVFKDEHGNVYKVWPRWGHFRIGPNKPYTFIPDSVEKSLQRFETEVNSAKALGDTGLSPKAGGDTPEHYFHKGDQSLILKMEFIPFEFTAFHTYISRLRKIPFFGPRKINELKNYVRECLLKAKINGGKDTEMILDSRTNKVRLIDLGPMGPADYSKPEAHKELDTLVDSLFQTKTFEAWQRRLRSQHE
jgi:hypothetical protein